MKPLDSHWAPGLLWSWSLIERSEPSYATHQPTNTNGPPFCCHDPGVAACGRLRRPAAGQPARRDAASLTGRGDHDANLAVGNPRANLTASSLDPAASLTIYSAASSEKTLRIMRLIAFLGMPFVLAYTAVIYWVFRGKVEIGKFSY